MAIGPDVVATALQDLAPGYSELFTLWHPLMERIVLRGNVDRASLKGPFREFVVVSDGPGSVTQVTTGSEVIQGGRRQNASRGSTYAPRLIYAFDVPGKDMAEANGENDLAKIIKRYPELALSDFHERISNQLAAGNGTDVGGFLTLNGEATYNPGLAAARTGVFEYDVSTNQGDTVFNLTKNAPTGWHNQYGNISSFSTDGKATMRQVYYKASRQGSKAAGPVDLMLGDESSYLNYIDDLDDQVRVMKIDGDKAPGQIRQGIPFLEADFFLEESIDVSAAAVFTTATTQAGVVYMLKTDTWHMYTLGHDSGMETKGDFAVRGPIRIPEQDMWRYEYVLNMGMYCDQLRANGVVTGGATA